MIASHCANCQWKHVCTHVARLSPHRTCNFLRIMIINRFVCSLVRVCFTYLAMHNRIGIYFVIVVNYVVYVRVLRCGGDISCCLNALSPPYCCLKFMRSLEQNVMLAISFLNMSTSCTFLFLSFIKSYINQILA